jgi:hypothetical protein
VDVRVHQTVLNQVGNVSNGVYIVVCDSQICKPGADRWELGVGSEVAGSPLAILDKRLAVAG